MGEYQYPMWQIVAVSYYYFFLNVRFQYEGDSLFPSESGRSHKTNNSHKVGLDNHEQLSSNELFVP
jgi:hypothetical protein